jgi:hypothetical protein
MNKIDEVLKLKELLDSGLINQSDFDRKKKEIFEETNNESKITNELISSELHQNIQERDNNSFDKRKCPQCGSENHVDNNDCIVCKTDLTKFRQPTEPYQEPDVETNYTRYFIIIVIIGLSIFGVFYIFKNYQTSNNEEAVGAIESISIDSTSSLSTKPSEIDGQESIVDTSYIKNESVSNDYNSNNENQNSDNYGYDNKPQDDDNADNTIYSTANIEVKPDFPGGIGNFYKYVGKNFQVPEEEGLKGKVFVTFVVEKDGSLTDIKVIKDIGYGTGSEAIRVLESCPRWIPAEQNGKKVRVQYSLPITISSAE